jgi:hypothetical protein
MSHIELVDLHASLVKETMKAHGKDPQFGPWNHLAKMLAEMRAMPIKTPDQREKFCRWLGFVQGVLWNHDYVTIDELRYQTRDLTYD